MAQQFTDFGDDSTGSVPSGWSGSSSDWSVISDASYEGGQALEVDSSANTFIEWTDGPQGASQVEVVTLVHDLASGDSTEVGPLSRYDFGNDNGYSGILNPNSYAYIVRVDGAGLAYLAGESIAPTGSWWIRTQLDGSTLRFRRWEDGTSEPSTWDEETTDSTYSSGDVGLGIFAAAQTSYVHTFDVVGVGTGGDAAPTEPVGGSAPTAPSNLNATLQ